MIEEIKKYASFIYTESLKYHNINSVSHRVDDALDSVQDSMFNSESIKLLKRLVWLELRQEATMLRNLIWEYAMYLDNALGVSRDADFDIDNKPVFIEFSIDKDKKSFKLKIVTETNTTEIFTELGFIRFVEQIKGESK